MPCIPDYCKEVVILCGDVPLLSADTVKRLVDDHVKAKRDISLLAVEMENPKGYGRILFDDRNHVTGIVEESDTTDEQKQIKMINTGVYCVKKEYLVDSVGKIKSDNAQGEFYLTDIIEMGYKDGKLVGALVGNDDKEFFGINSNEDLAKAENIMKSQF